MMERGEVIYPRNHYVTSYNIITAHWRLIENNFEELFSQEWADVATDLSSESGMV